MVHQSKGKPFVHQLARNLSLQLFCEKKKYPQPKYTSETKQRNKCVPSEHSLSDLEVTYLMSHTIILENPGFLFGKKNKGKILFSSCQLEIMHSDGHSTYMIFLLIMDMNIKAQRIGVTFPGSLVSKWLR